MSIKITFKKNISEKQIENYILFSDESFKIRALNKLSLSKQANVINKTVNTNKSKETSPDVLGNFDYNTFKFMFAGWKQVKKYDDNTEKKYLSVSVQFDKEQPEKGLNEFEKTEDKELDDDIPF